MNLLILSGNNETPFLDDGWYGLERSPEGILYRAAKPQAWLQLPVEGTIKLTLYLSARPAHTNKPLILDVKGNEIVQDTLTLDTNHWTTRASTISLQKDQLIQFHTRNAWSPDTLYQNGDIRAIGFLLSSIRIDSV